MPTLIACLSTGKGTWSEVTKIINSQPWSRAFLVTNAFGKENFNIANSQVELVPINSFLETVELVEQIKAQLHGKITDFEVGLNVVSGSGKEHMAVLEAVLELGLNFRLITINKGQVQTLGLRR